MEWHAPRPVDRRVHGACSLHPARADRDVKITLLSDDHIRLEPASGPLTIEAESPAMTYSPFHMMASGLAVGTLSVLHSWASHAALETDGLRVDVTWSVAEVPHRVGEYRVSVTWPGLPDARRSAAERVAELCAVHNTFTHPPAIAMEVTS